MIMFDAATQRRREFIYKVCKVEDELAKQRQKVRQDNLRRLAGNWSYQGQPQTAYK